MVHEGRSTPSKPELVGTSAEPAALAICGSPFRRFGAATANMFWPYSSSPASSQQLLWPIPQQVAFFASSRRDAAIAQTDDSFFATFAASARVTWSSLIAIVCALGISMLVMDCSISGGFWGTCSCNNVPLAYSVDEYSMWS